MGVLANIRGLLSVLMGATVEKQFDVRPVKSPEMDAYIAKCVEVYSGHPYWVDVDDGIKTVNVARTVCSEVARLTVMGTKIEIDGGKRAEELQKQIDDLYFLLRSWVEYACAYGTIILKPNGDGVDLYLPTDFAITDTKNGKITGITFRSRQRSADGKKTYIRLEYHRYENGKYKITNKCFEADDDGDENTGKPIEIERTPWADLEPEVELELEKPLYAVFKMPSANHIDIRSVLGVPIFADALEELKDLDIAYSRSAEEIMDSRRIVLLDSDRLIPTKGMVSSEKELEKGRKRLSLPRFVKSIMGSGEGDVYHEIQPSLNTAIRSAGIDQYLSQIGYKCGFSNGYFVFDQKSGMVTATQVESDDRRTIQLIKDVRDQLESCLDDLIFALSEMADIYETTAPEEYEVIYDFGDLTYNHEEDRLRWWGYVVQGKVPAWMYFNKFEAMSEEDAKAMVEEAQPVEQPELFAEE